MKTVTVLGGGPAGSAAAIAARSEGWPVRLIEKSRLPRHKVCGEFLSPEIVPLLERLGVWDRFLERQPARIRRLILRFPRKEKQATLPEEAFGLSRFEFDRILFDEACRRGAEHVRESGAAGVTPLVIATGRAGDANGKATGERLFGFKAHYRGPASDAVELHFFSGCYVGVSAVEDGLTNVCGLGPEPVLRSHGFEPDKLLASSDALRQRLRPLSRSMDWLTTGPLVFRNRFRERPSEGVYLAGDSLSFVDPFTGSGLLGAVLTGLSAGQAAASGLDAEAHHRRCQRALRRAFAVARLFRWALVRGWAAPAASVLPGQLLVQWTRPRVTL